MQIYPINNINNNPKFGTLKGLRYAGEFNPSTNYEHAKIVDAVINSKAIKQFGEKYNFLARLKRSNGYEPITMTRFYDGYYYSLELIPAPVERPQASKLTLWERIFGKKKNNAEAKAPVEETPKEEKIKNLPVEILITNVIEKYNSDAINKFIRQIKSETLDSIESTLQYYIYEQNNEQQKKEIQMQEHAHILNEIKDAGF